MKYFFSEIDEITLTFSDIQANRDGMEYIRIYFEHPNANGFDFLESTLPALSIKKSAGFWIMQEQMLFLYGKSLARELKKLPQVVKLLDYLIFFWSNENDELIHVHV